MSKNTKHESSKTRKKANSTSNKATSSTPSKSISDLVEGILPSSIPQTPLDPKKVAFLGIEVNPNTGEEEAIMQVHSHAKYVSAPPKLSSEELAKLFSSPLVSKTIILGDTTISGMVAQKQEIQG